MPNNKNNPFDRPPFPNTKSERVKVNIDKYPIVKFEIENLRELIIAQIISNQEAIAAYVAEETKRQIEEYDFKKTVDEIVQEALNYYIQKTIQENLSRVLHDAIKDAVYTQENRDALQKAVAEKLHSLILGGKVGVKE